MEQRRKTIVAIVLAVISIGMPTTISAQTGSPAGAQVAPAPVQGQPNVAPAVTAPPPQVAAPVQTTTAPPRARIRSQKGRAAAPVTKPIEQAPAQVPAASAAPSASPVPNRKRNAKVTQPQTQQRPTIAYAEAVKRQHRERHSQTWWKSRYKVIVFVTGCGYYYWDAGYWFPALGYYPSYEFFDYNGPIYTYGELLPDQVIYNVQRALKELGYYEGPLTGSFSAATRAAIAAFQADNDLEVTGAIDEGTVQALGLI